MDCKPAGSGVAATEKHLIDSFVTGAAIPCGEMGTDGEAVLVDPLLALSGLLAIQVIDAFYRVSRHLGFMDD
jgi:hypothetical protein